MELGIKEVSQRTGISETTIRYYDNEGLLPFLKRRESHYRIFDDESLNMLQIIKCLKSTGMSIKDIKKFSNWIQEGDSTLEQRYELFLKQREKIQTMMSELQTTLDVVNHKCNYYQKAIEAGTDQSFKSHDQLPHHDEFICKKD